MTVSSIADVPFPQICRSFALRSEPHCRTLLGCKEPAWSALDVSLKLLFRSVPRKHSSLFWDCFSDVRHLYRESTVQEADRMRSRNPSRNWRFFVIWQSKGRCVHLLSTVIRLVLSAACRGFALLCSFCSANKDQHNSIPFKPNPVGQPGSA